MAEPAKPERNTSDDKTQRPVPVRRKTGERPGNLRKREEWFRKRSG